MSDILIDSDPNNGRSGPLSFSFRLTDRESNPADAEILVVPPGGAQPFQALLVGAPSNSALGTSPSGVVHQRVWDYSAQLPSGSAFALGYQLEVSVVGGSSRSFSPAFAVGNDAPTISPLVAPTGELTGPVRIDCQVADSSDDIVSVVCEYEDLDQPQGWSLATSVGPPLTNIACAAGGVPVAFVWDVPADEGGRELRARLRLTPADGWATGAAATVDLVIDNNAAPLAIVSGSAFFADPDSRRGIPLPLRVIDDEGDPVRVVVQWRTAFQAFPALPSTPLALDALLADPALVRQYQVATEIPKAHRGRIVPTASPSVVRLPELAGRESTLQAGTLVGRELELMRPNSAPARVASSWTSNPLTSPVAVLPTADGALVLETVGGGWRLREIDTATGNVLADIAALAGRSPDALARSFSDELTVLLADDAGGVWRLSRVELANHVVTTLYTTSGALALGSVRGLVATGASTVLLTVGSSLIQVDLSNSALPTEEALFSGFAAPRGLAYDRKQGSRVFLAERDWVNPATSAVEGRVVRIDLSSRERVGVTATNQPFLRPTALALERDGTRVLALTDANTSDGTVELRAVDLGSAEKGRAYEIEAGLPGDAVGLATGADGERLLALPASGDLALGGGVLQRRRITSFDAATLEATTESPLDPPPIAAQPWRIRGLLGDLPTSAAGTDDVFLWDSTDVSQGGAVILGAVPYDSEPGLATDTGVPRTVRSGIDVPATSVGSSLVTDGVSGLELVDLNADGQLDLVTANVGTDNVTAFYQVSEGSFPSSPNLSLTGVSVGAPMTDPVAVRVLDADQDNDLDVVVLNRGSNNFNIFRQQSGTFAAVTPLLVQGLSQPGDLAVGDMNADGLVDLVIADTGQNQIEIFQQLLTGLFPTSSSSTLGNGSTLSPAAVGVADLDGDGDLDIVSADTGSNSLAIFLRGPGGFSSSPSQLLGGSGATTAPIDVVVTDLDADGRVDIACANQGGNSLAAFIQGTAGFASAPDHVLSDSTGPFLPRRLAAADMNADGTPDLVSLNGGNDLTIFSYDGKLGSYAPEPLIVGAQSGFVAPSCLGIADVDGDGFADIAAGDSIADVVELFYHDDGATFGALPQLTLGNQIDTPAVNAVAAADLDGDGDLDLACADSGDGTISVYQQVSPSVIIAKPAQRLSSAALTPSLRSVSAADLDGDGRVDLVGVVPSPGELALFLQASDGTFPSAPGSVLGGALGAPAHVVAADLDGDGAPDLVCANETGDGLSVFLRSSLGSFPTSPTQSLGSTATTNGPVRLVAADLDGDGDLDLVSANRDGNDLALFLDGPAGFPTSPSLKFGGGGQTDSPRDLVIEDLDVDGDLDLACACANENGIALFLQHAPGSFSVAPDQLLTHSLVSIPTTLGAIDLDGDGDQDLISGNQGGPNLIVFRQTSPGRFAAVPSAIGGAGSVDSVLSLLALDLDGDGDADLVSAHPSLNRVAVFFGSH